MLPTVDVDLPLCLRQIKNAPRQNIDPKVARIRELQREVAALRMMLTSCPACRGHMQRPVIRCDLCGKEHVVDVGVVAAGLPNAVGQASSKCCVVM